jgi:flagellar protein FlgJ
MQRTIPASGDIMRIDSKTSDNIAKLKKPGGNLLSHAQQDPEKVAKLAEEFEAQFIAQMLESMFNTVPVSEELGGGYGEESYRSLLVDEYGKILSRTGGIGMADAVKREVLRSQEVE